MATAFKNGDLEIEEVAAKVMNKMSQNQQKYADQNKEKELIRQQLENQIRRKSAKIAEEKKNKKAKQDPKKKSVKVVVGASSNGADDVSDDESVLNDRTSSVSDTLSLSDIQENAADALVSPKKRKAKKQQFSGE